MPLLQEWIRNMQARKAASTIAPLGVIGDLVQNVHHEVHETTCDVNSVVGPFACMHNEHNEILRTLDKVIQNQGVLQNHIDSGRSELATVNNDLRALLERNHADLLRIEGKADRILKFLDDKFEGSP